MVIKSRGSLKYSPIESRRFGIRIYRWVLDGINPEEILSTVLKQNIDVAIISIPAERQDSLSCLQEIGIPLCRAEGVDQRVFSKKPYITIHINILMNVSRCQFKKRYL